MIAFTAAVLEERNLGDPQLALYHGWLNVIVYYQHYHATGGLPKLTPIEQLIADEQAGILHPARFGRIDL